MASAFNLTAQINLRGPTNIKPVVRQIRKEFSSIKTDVKLTIDKRAAQSLDTVKNKFDALNSSIAISKKNVRDLNVLFKDLSTTLSSTKSFNLGGEKSLASTGAAAKKAAKDIQTSTTAIEDFGKKSQLAFKRFAAFTLVTSGIYAIVNAVNNGIRAFIDFERQIIRLRQVTQAGAVGIGSLEKEITNLAKSLGVSSASLAEASVTLAQAGLNADQTRIALSALAKTELAPSFDNITSTTEGAIAALRQFGLQAKDLESVLGSINAVAAQFAVESGDIIAAIQRTGGVFAAASKGVSEGKDALNEFIAVFTSVRATTRESAETIATGLRTIFTRIQRGSTIKQLEDFGVQLTDLEGKFVGPFEAIKRLSEALNQLDPRDIRFSSIVEELGGFRQIGKVIPLIQQFATAQEALKVAQQGAGSLSEAQALAQQSLANQIARVREEFLALIREVGKSTTFQVITKTVLGLASGLIKLAGAFKPILPILGILGAVKGVSAISQFASGFFGLSKGGGGGDTGADTVAQSERERAEATNRASDAIKENTNALNSLTNAIQSLESKLGNSDSSKSLNLGGKVLGFNKGGVVPGSGKGDKVPALLEPGEVVINNKAASQYGRNNLDKMNKYAFGGSIKELISTKPELQKYFDTEQDKDLYNLFNIKRPKDKTSFKQTREQYRQRAETIWQEASGILRDTGSLREANDYIKRKTKINPGNYDAQELDPSNRSPRRFNRIQGALAEQTTRTQTTGLKKLPNQAGADFVYTNSNGTNFVEVKNRIEPTKNEDLISKALLGYAYINGKPPTYYKNNKLDNISGLNIELRSSNPLDIQKFAEGSFGGIRVPSGKGRGVKGSKGARDIIEPISTETYLKWAKGIYDEYDADPSLVMAIGDSGERLPPEIALANRLLSQYALETGGAGLALGKRFVRTPKDKITDELQPYLVPDPSDPNELGFFEDDIRKFGKAKALSQGSIEKLGKEAALQRAMARQETYTNAESAISSFKETGILDVDSSIMQYLKKSIANPDSLPLEPKQIDKLKKKLTRPNLEAFDKLVGPDNTPVSVQGQRTKLSEVFNTILATYDSDVSDLEVDNIIQGIGSKLQGKNLGGIIQKFMSGSVGGVSSNKNDLATMIERLGGPQSVRGLVGGQMITDLLRSVPSDATPVTAKRLLSKNFVLSDASDPYTKIISKIVEKAKANQKTPRVFTDKEKANATKVGLVGMIPFGVNELLYEEIGGKILAIQMRSLTEDKAKIVEQIRKDIDAVLGKGTQALYGDPGKELDDATKEALGLGNLEGYMIEAILAKAGANPGNLNDRSVDYASGLGKAASLFGIDPDIPTEVKRDVKGGLSKARINFKNYFSKLALGGSVDSAKPKKNFGQISLRNDGNRVQATYINDGSETRSGSVYADKINSNLFAVQSSSATKGYGPKLYDVVMEAVTSNGGMLTSDRRTVSSAAKGVWDFYFKNRSDVNKTPLDPVDWVSNPRLIDEKLYGPPETWPPFDDPAWVLQTGYSKTPSDINDPNLVQRLAAGGKSNTVPAMVSNGEAFVPPQVAKKIGYANLDRMNKADRNGMGKYAGGGGISVFKGPGSGTSDSIGPIGLPKGSYVIREKATKALGFSKGGSIRKFREGGDISSQNETTAANITKVIQTLEVSGTGTTSAIERLEDIVANLLNETTSSKDAVVETAQIITLLKNANVKSNTDQISSLNNILQAIESTGDFQSAAIEKQNDAIAKFLAQTKGKPGTTIVGQFPPPEEAGPTTASKEDILAEVNADRARAEESIAQAAFAAGKGLEEFINDLDEFYNTVKNNQLAKLDAEIDAEMQASGVSGMTGTMGESARKTFEQRKENLRTDPNVQRQLAMQATAATEQYGGVELGDFLINDFENLSDVIHQEIEARKAAIKAEEEAAAESKKQAEQYKNSGDAFRDFGALGVAMPEQAMKMKDSKLLASAKAIQSPKALQGFNKALERLPGPLGNVTRMIGGLPGILSLTASVIGSELLPKLGEAIGLGESETFAGVAGALAEGGSQAVSLGTLGQQLLGPIGALIGTIGGAISGAISGYIKGVETKKLENSLNALSANSLEASRALEKLSKTDTAENANAASKAVGKLQSNIKDLGQQAEVDTGADMLTTGAQFASYGALIGASIGTFLLPAIGTGIGAAIGAGIGAVTGAIAGAFSGPDELDSEALKAQLEAIEQYVDGINQLGQRRLQTKTVEEVQQFLTDLENAQTPEEKAAVGARTVRVEEAQRAELQRFGIEDNESVQDFLGNLSGSTQRSAKAAAEAAKQNYLYSLGMDELNKKYKGNEKKIREIAKNEADVIALGEQRNIQLGEEEAKQRILAAAMKQVEQRLANLADVFKKINAGIKRFSDETTQYISDIESQASGLLGDAQLRNVNRENERILSNPLAYSEQEVRRAGMSVEGLAGGGPEGAQIGNIALASKLIEENLPALLRGVTEGNVDPALDAIRGYFETAGIDTTSGEFSDIFKQIEQSLERAASGGEGATLDELSIANEIIPQISKILEQGREVAVNIQKEYNNTLQKTIDLQNKANQLLLKANEYERKAQQIRLSADVQLAEKFGEELSLEELNRPFTNNIESLTSGLIPGGTTDPTAIADAVIESNRRIEERQKKLDASRSAVGLVGAGTGGGQASADLMRANEAEKKAIAEEIRKTNEATKALETLANSGDQAANALKVFDQIQRKVNGFTNFIDKLITGSPEEVFQIGQQQQAANLVISGQATDQMMRSPEFRRQASAGISQLQDVLSPEDYRRTQAQFRRRSLEAAGVDLSQETGVTDSEGNVLTLDELLKRAENPEDTPEIKAYKAAAEAQAKAAEEMARLNREAASIYEDASQKLIDFFTSQFPSIVEKAFADVKATEESARETTRAAQEKPKPKTPTQTEQDLARATAVREQEEADLRQATAVRRQAEGSRRPRRGSGRNRNRRRTYNPGLDMAIGLEQNAREDFLAAKAEEDRLKAKLEEEKRLEQEKVAEAKAKAKAEKEAQLASERAAASQPVSPAEQRFGSTQPLIPQASASTENSSQNLQNASNSLVEASNNLQTASEIIVSGGATATPNNASATTSVSVSVQNISELQDSLQITLNPSTIDAFTSFATSLDNSFSTFSQNFGSYVARLEEIEFPEKIEMIGRHTVDVRITGAAAFESLEDSVKNLVTTEITKKMNDLWRQSDGNYGERPG